MSRSLRQRCLFTERENILAKVAAHPQDEFKAAYWAISTWPTTSPPARTPRRWCKARSTPSPRPTAATTRGPAVACSPAGSNSPRSCVSRASTGGGSGTPTSSSPPSARTRPATSSAGATDHGQALGRRGHHQRRTQHPPIKGSNDMPALVAALVAALARHTQPDVSPACDTEESAQKIRDHHRTSTSNATCSRQPGAIPARRSTPTSSAASTSTLVPPWSTPPSPYR